MIKLVSKKIIEDLFTLSKYGLLDDSNPKKLTNFEYLLGLYFVPNKVQALMEVLKTNELKKFDDVSASNWKEFEHSKNPNSAGELRVALTKFIKERSMRNFNYYKTRDGIKNANGYKWVVYNTYEYLQPLNALLADTFGVKTANVIMNKAFRENYLVYRQDKQAFKLAAKKKKLQQ